MIEEKSKIYIAGHRGMVGSACWRILEEQGYVNLIGKSSEQIDLRNQRAVNEFIKFEKPDIIINAAARVGGILANNTYPYEFLMDNMLIQNNLISAAHTNNISKFIFLGSSCIYPKMAPQPLKEEYLLTGSLESTNEWYALAKISGVKLIHSLRKQYKRDYVALMPTNLYGPGDNYDLNSSHVLPAMIRKFHDAKIKSLPYVKLWGSGSPLREFLHVDDLANAISKFIYHKPTHYIYNVGSGEELSIKDLALLVKNITNYSGNLVWDDSKPDGTPRKLLDFSRIKGIGFKPKIRLKQGIINTYKQYFEGI